MVPTPPTCSLDEVIVRPAAHRAEPSPARQSLETEAFLALSQTLAHKPERATQQLVDAGLRLTSADSAGLTLESDEAGEAVLRWIATAGEFTRYRNHTMPREFSPCGEAMARRKSLVMRDPVRFYPYIEGLHVPVRSALLVPFGRAGKLVGTVWMVAHTAGRSFTTEDQRLVEALATFASAILDAGELRARAAGT